MFNCFRLVTYPWHWYSTVENACYGHCREDILVCGCDGNSFSDDICSKTTLASLLQWLCSQGYVVVGVDNCTVSLNCTSNALLCNSKDVANAQCMNGWALCSLVIDEAELCFMIASYRQRFFVVDSSARENDTELKKAIEAASAFNSCSCRGTHTTRWRMCCSHKRTSGTGYWRARKQKCPRKLTNRQWQRKDEGHFLFTTIKEEENCSIAGSLFIWD